MWNNELLKCRSLSRSLERCNKKDLPAEFDRRIKLRRKRVLPLTIYSSKRVETTPNTFRDALHSGPPHPVGFFVLELTKRLRALFEFDLDSFQALRECKKSRVNRSSQRLLSASACSGQHLPLVITPGQIQHVIMTTHEGANPYTNL